MLRVEVLSSNTGTIQFFTDAASVVADGSPITPTERVRINSSGLVGIGDSSPLALLTVGSGDLFQVNADGNITLNQTSPVITLLSTSTLNITNGTNNYFGFDVGNNVFSFGQASPDISITDATTISVTDGTNTILTLTDLGTTGILTVDTLVTNNSLALSGLTQGSVLFAGPTGILSEDNTNFFWDDDNNSLGIGLTPVAGTRLTLPQENDAVTPTLAFGDGDTGFYEGGDDRIEFASAGSYIWQLDANILGSSATGRPEMRNEVASATNPTLIPSHGDANTGIGWAAADQLSLIAGGVEGIRINEVGSAISSIDLFGDLAFQEAGPSVSITDGTTLAITDGTNVLFTFTDDGSTGEDVVAYVKPEVVIGTIGNVEGRGTE